MAQVFYASDIKMKSEMLDFSAHHCPAGVSGPMYKPGRKQKESTMRPAIPAFTDGLFIEMTVTAPPTTDGARVTAVTDTAQEPERWDGLS